MKVRRLLILSSSILFLGSCSNGIISHKADKNKEVSFKDFIHKSLVLSEDLSFKSHEEIYKSWPNKVTCHTYGFAGIFKAIISYPDQNDEIHITYQEDPVDFKFSYEKYYLIGNYEDYKPSYISAYLGEESISEDDEDIKNEMNLYNPVSWSGAPYVVLRFGNFIKEIGEKDLNDNDYLDYYYMNITGGFISSSSNYSIEYEDEERGYYKATKDGNVILQGLRKYYVLSFNENFDNKDVHFYDYGDYLRWEARRTIDNETDYYAVEVKYNGFITEYIRGGRTTTYSA